MRAHFDTGKKLTVERIADIYQHRSRGIMGEARYSKSGVIVPLVRNADGSLAILFEKRAKTLRRQAGEICFPGGHCEENDHNEWQTALRETTEELQIPAEQIEYLGKLDILIGPSLIIYPFIAMISDHENITPNPEEVDLVFTVELERLLRADPEVHEIRTTLKPDPSFPFHLIPNGENYQWRSGKIQQMFYQFEGHVIWGLTARILYHFLEVIREHELGSPPDC